MAPPLAGGNLGAGNYAGGWVAAATGPCSAATGPNGCFDNSYWDIGTRTQWNVSKEFYMGIDVVYTHLGAIAKGATFAMPSNGSMPAAPRVFSDQDALSVQFRVHRDFYP